MVDLIIYILIFVIAFLMDIASQQKYIYRLGIRVMKLEMLKARCPHTPLSESEKASYSLKGDFYRGRKLNE